VWSQWTQARRDRFQADRQRQVELHGEQVVHMMETFYTAVAGLFTGGRLGGVRITGSKAANNKDLQTGRQMMKARRKKELAEVIRNVNCQL